MYFRTIKHSQGDGFLPHEGVARRSSFQMVGTDTPHSRCPTSHATFAIRQADGEPNPDALLGRWREVLGSFAHILYDIISRWQSHLTHLARASLKFLREVSTNLFCGTP